MNENAPKRIRIAVYSLKGCRPRPLDDGGMQPKYSRDAVSRQRPPRTTWHFPTPKICYNTRETKMSSIIGSSKEDEVEKKVRLREKVIPPLTLLLVIAITVTLFLYRDTVAELGSYGYLGAFLISLVANATIILPMPVILLIFALGAAFNPVLVGLVGAAGGAVGETTGYMIGYSGYRIARSSKVYDRAEGWMRRWGVVAIFVFALAPFLPLDVAGILAGVLRFPIWKFLLACWFGKALLYVGAALAGAWGGEAFVSGLHFISPISIGLLAAVATLALLTLALVIENWVWKRDR